MSRFRKRLASILQGSKAAFLCASLTILAVGCKPSVDKSIADAESSVAAKDYGPAIQTLNGVLGSQELTAPQRVAAQNLKLKALALSGQGTEAVALLESLAKDSPSAVSANLYINVGRYLQEGGAMQEAIDVLAAGDKAYPEETEAFKAQIESIKASDSIDDDEIEKLKALGYM